MDVNDTNVQADCQLLNKKQTKKCHGNRRDQRFRKKCRARGMKPARIEKLLSQRKQTGRKNNRKNDYITYIINDSRKTTTTISNKVSDQDNDASKQTTTMTTNLNKRKREISLQELKSTSTIPKSTSSISIGQPLSKKMKKKRKIITMPVIKENNNRINTNYRFVLIFMSFSI
jgi:hypothetical protein